MWKMLSHVFSKNKNLPARMALNDTSFTQQETLAITLTLTLLPNNPLNACACLNMACGLDYARLLWGFSDILYI